ncbi:MAG: hypothetical protein ACRCSN_21670 [Dermatophilaceae bacterium]
MFGRVLISAAATAGLAASGLVSALPSAAATPASFDFGSQTIFSERFETITVDVTVGAGYGSPAITASSAAPGTFDDFYVAEDTCEGVAAAATCAVTVGFVPSGSGARAANLVIPTAVGATHATVTLTGGGAVDATGTYYRLGSPTRFLDTRTSGTRRPLSSGASTTVQIGGRSGIPTSGVSAVVLNVTAVSTTATGYFTLWPSGASRPTVSSINFPRAWTGANLVTVPVGSTGAVSLYNSGGSAHALVDVLGWYAKDDSVRASKGMGTQLQALTPTRIFDSRNTSQPGSGVFYNGDYIDFEDDFGSAFNPLVRAYAMNITAVSATGPGYVTAWSGSGTRPNTSTVNYETGVVAPNMAVVPTSLTPEGRVRLRLENFGSGSVHLIADLVGVYTQDEASGLRFKPLPSPAPRRILDTRSGTGLSGAFTGGATRTLDASSIVGADSVMVVGNVTGVTPTSGTYLTIWDGESTRPTVSNINVSTGKVRAASVFAPLSGPGGFDIFNASGSMNVLFDVAGTFENYPPLFPAARAASKAARTNDPGAVSASAERLLDERTSTVRRG